MNVWFGWKPQMVEFQILLYYASKSFVYLSPVESPPVSLCFTNWWISHAYYFSWKYAVTNAHTSWMLWASRLPSRLSRHFNSHMLHGIFTKGPLQISQICLFQMYQIFQFRNLVNYYIIDEMCMWQKYISTKANWKTLYKFLELWILCLPS